MTSQPKHVSEGYHSITPYLVLKGATAALAFYKKAFGAQELMRITGAEGRVRHAEIKIGDSALMLADENPQYLFMRSPQSLSGTPVHLHLYVEDVDALARQAIAAGATVLMPVEDSGEDRWGGLVDPFGHIWWVATRIEDVSREEIQKRFEADTQSEDR